MLRVFLAGMVAGLWWTGTVRATEPVTLVIKPLLCVIEKQGGSCAVTFDIRWKSLRPGEYCLGDSLRPAPLHCWPRSLSGELRQQRVFSEDFSYRLTPVTGGEPLSEVKIEVLRLGSTDRRRERRTRHVWDVL